MGKQCGVSEKYTVQHECIVFSAHQERKLSMLFRINAVIASISFGSKQGTGQREGGQSAITAKKRSLGTGRSFLFAARATPIWGIGAVLKPSTSIRSIPFALTIDPMASARDGPLGPHRTQAAAPACLNRKESLPVSSSLIPWTSCLITATRTPFSPNAGISFSIKVVFPEPDQPEKPRMGRAASFVRVWRRIVFILLAPL